jgi:hypothetical protein
VGWGGWVGGGGGTETLFRRKGATILPCQPTIAAQLLGLAA